MKILYVTSQAVSPNAQGDFQENMILHGLRNVIGKNVVDIPRKKVMYGDFSEVTRTQLHGRGFTLYDGDILDLDAVERQIDPSKIDVILYGITNAYGITDYQDLNKLCDNIWYIDGHDTPDIKKKPCFKRELFNATEGVYPTGFGIPSKKIRPIHFNKTRKYQTTAPEEAYFKPIVMQHLRNHYTYEWHQEKEYYDDMASSWFGLTCKKGGWDSLRHYEIMAAGSLLLFREYEQKPKLCAPVDLPCMSYTSLEHLEEITNSLVYNDKPTKKYYELLFAQREWLLKYGTTEARALQILDVLKETIDG